MRSQLSEVDRKMLRLLVDSRGRVSSNELSQQLDIPLSSVQSRRKRLVNTYLLKHDSLDPTRFGWRRIDLLIHTNGGNPRSVGKALLKRKEVTNVARTIGEHTIDLRVEIVVKDYGMLLNFIEETKAMNGVNNVIWTEVVETIGSKRPQNYIAL